MADSDPMGDMQDEGDEAIAQTPQYVASRKAAEERIAAGDYGTPADEFFDELDHESKQQWAERETFAILTTPGSAAALDEGIAELDAGQDTDGPEFLEAVREGLRDIAAGRVTDGPTALAPYLPSHRSS